MPATLLVRAALCLAIVACCGAVGGCTLSNPSAEAGIPQAQPTTTQPPARVGTSVAARVDRIEPVRPEPAPQDPVPKLVERYAVRVISLEVPRGAVSADEALWKRMDETALSPAAYDVLYANGIRVGIAPVAELERLASWLDADAWPSETRTVVGRRADNHEMPMGGAEVEQTIFWFDRRKRHVGRTFGPSENLLALGFWQTPRRAEMVRLSLTPVVRSRQRTLRFTPMGRDQALAHVRDETLYDVNLRADVAIGDFLIVAPSTESTWETSLGRIFFCRDNGGEEMERVLVLIPVALELAK